MTDNKLIKAIKCCVEVDETGDFIHCCGCPYAGKCSESLMSDIYDLINRQKKEIEALTSANKQLVKFEKEERRELWNSHKTEIAKLREIQSMQADIVTALKEQTICQTKIINFLECQTEQAKSEAIKEFAERIKERLK